MLSTPTPQKNNSKLLYAVSLGLELGFLIALPLVFFLALGLFLDKKLGTLPIFLISSIILGLVATVINVYYLVLPFLEKRSQKK
ncbi:AtpZ/AtpI family protein [Patescibacteria group bacterium]|nr:AtpZ/AtpI family protein [Patescibacteria group bacterium]MBU4481543.1 AtpZ/AtpI family protein [Patescibacteria group bacterium]